MNHILIVLRLEKYHVRRLAHGIYCERIKPSEYVVEFSLRYITTKMAAIIIKHATNNL